MIVAKLDVNGDHDLVQERLEGGISPLVSPSVSVIILDNFDHTFHRGTSLHNFLEGPGVLHLRVSLIPWP